MNLHLFIDAKDDGRGVENCNYKRCKTPIKSSPPKKQNRILRSLMPLLSSHQKRRSTYDKLIQLLFIDERTHAVNQFIVKSNVHYTTLVLATAL